eukprot:Pgem_evm1s19232
MAILLNSYPTNSNVNGTYWGPATDTGGCQMPTATYAIDNAIAVGWESQLGDLTMTNDLCGHVLKINCGYGDVEAVIASTCDVGKTTCGVDMVLSTWNTATNNMSPGQALCNVTFTDTNPMSASGIQ